MNLNKAAIAQGLKDLRLEKGYTQEFIASALGKAEASSIYRLEYGKAEPKMEDVVKLAELYGVSIDEIIYPEKRKKQLEVAEERAPYFSKKRLQVSVELDGNQVSLARQVDMLIKVNAALSEI